MGIDPDLLAILADPVTKEPLEEVEEPDGHWLVCRASGRRYPVRDGIPVLLPEEGVPLGEGGGGAEAAGEADAGAE
jgi:hypothetical protein